MPVVVPPKQCSGCGKCCWLVVVLLDEDKDVPDAMVVVREFEDGTVERVMDRNPDDGFCVALDPETKLCTIYERRPAICREFMSHTEGCIDAIFKVDDGYVNRHVVSDLQEEMQSADE